MCDSVIRLKRSVYIRDAPLHSSTTFDSYLCQRRTVVWPSDGGKILGWSRSTLDSRLALLNCSTAVLDALSERKINIAHAELLAALSKENQDKVLPVVVAEKRSVADVRKLVESASCALASAIFGRSDHRTHPLPGARPLLCSPQQCI